MCKFRRTAVCLTCPYPNSGLPPRMSVLARLVPSPSPGLQVQRIPSRSDRARQSMRPRWIPITISLCEEIEPRNQSIEGTSASLLYLVPPEWTCPNSFVFRFSPIRCFETRDRPDQIEGARGVQILPTTARICNKSRGFRVFHKVRNHGQSRSSRQAPA